MAQWVSFLPSSAFISMVKMLEEQRLCPHYFLTTTVKYKIQNIKAVVMMIVFVISKYLQRMPIQFVDCLLPSTHLSLSVWQ